MPPKRHRPRRRSVKKGTKIGACHYHLCEKRMTKLYRCKHCRELFCREHLNAKPPGTPNFEASSPKAKQMMEEWHQRGGHPCTPYFDFAEKEVERKNEEYERALDQAIKSGHTTKRRHFEPHWSPPHKPYYKRRKPFFNQKNTFIIALIVLSCFLIIMDSQGQLEPMINNLKQIGNDIIGNISDGYESWVTTSEEKSKGTIEYVNQFRRENGKREISFDKRVYDLAIARVQDMWNYSYLDHVNPITGKCPDNMKTEFGLKGNEYVAENAAEGASEFESVDIWMDSRGHRYNLLYDLHTAGAVACYHDKCVFLGLNNQMFGSGCHTAAEGEFFWDFSGKQPGEV